jgi:hypothetical protein
MNWRKYLCTLMVSIFLVSYILSRAAAMDNDAARASLRGIEAIRLAVEELTPEIVNEGLNSDKIHRSLQSIQPLISAP